MTNDDKNRFFFFLRIFRMSENPLECRPDDGTAKTISFNLILFFVNKFFFSTKPTANPAKSNLFFSYVPGISAVSPPTKEQPANLHP